MTTRRDLGLRRATRVGLAACLAAGLLASACNASRALETSAPDAGERESGTGSPDAAASSCTAVDCPPAARITKVVSIPDEDLLPGVVIEVCRNDTCVGGSRIWLTPSSSASGTGWTFPASVEEFRGGGHAQFVLWAGYDGVTTRYAGITSVEIRWWPWAPLDVVDGDNYRATLKNKDGKVLVEIAERVEAYEQSTPNGPGCPPVCRHVVINR